MIYDRCLAAFRQTDYPVKIVMHAPRAGATHSMLPEELLIASIDRERILERIVVVEPELMSATDMQRLATSRSYARAAQRMIDTTRSGQ